jgi:hypothetical protein
MNAGKNRLLIEFKNYNFAFNLIVLIHWSANLQPPLASDLLPYKHFSTIIIKLLNLSIFLVFEIIISILSIT